MRARPLSRRSLLSTSVAGLSRLNDASMNLPRPARSNVARSTGLLSVRPRIAVTWLSISE
jgi:hypothetical protein